VAAVALVVLASGCGALLHTAGHPVAVSGGPSSPVTTTTTAPPTTTTPPPPPPVDFGPAVKAAIAAVPNGAIAIAVYDRQLGTMVATYRGDVPYYTESVVKLLIGLDSLDRGGSADKVAEMLSRSDDNTATALWDADGGSAIVTRMAAKIGLTATTPPRRSGEWGDSQTTAGDLVTIYQYILGVAPAAERDVVVNALHAATNLGADGTDQYFGIPYAVGSSQQWAVKQGWACCEPGWVLNTTGLVGADYRYIVVVLTTHSNGGGAAVRKVDSQQLTNAVAALLPDLKP
jgi:hypothetical protein